MEYCRQTYAYFCSYRKVNLLFSAPESSVAEPEPIGFLAEAGADLNFDLADNLGLLQLLFLERENIFIFV